MRPEFLLIDISNSFTKFALASCEKLGEGREIATAKLDAATLRKITRGWKFERVVLSSVVPAKSTLIASLKKAVLRVSPNLKLGVGVDYPNPKRIGADRLANA